MGGYTSWRSGIGLLYSLYMQRRRSGRQDYFWIFLQENVLFAISLLPMVCLAKERRYLHDLVILCWSVCINRMVVSPWYSIHSIKVRAVSILLDCDQLGRPSSMNLSSISTGKRSSALKAKKKRFGQFYCASADRHLWRAIRARRTSQAEANLASRANIFYQYIFQGLRWIQRQCWWNLCLQPTRQDGAIFVNIWCSETVSQNLLFGGPCAAQSFSIRSTDLLCSLHTAHPLQW